MSTSVCVSALRGISCRLVDESCEAVEDSSDETVIVLLRSGERFRVKVDNHGDSPMCVEVVSTGCFEDDTGSRLAHHRVGRGKAEQSRAGRAGHRCTMRCAVVSCGAVLWRDVCWSVGKRDAPAPFRTGREADGWMDGWMDGWTHLCCRSLCGRAAAPMGRSSDSTQTRQRPAAAPEKHDREEVAVRVCAGGGCRV